MASAPSRKSAASPVSTGTYTASRPLEASARLCIAGEAECPSGDPTSAKIRVDGPVCLARYRSIKSAAGNWPGAAEPP
jgi:hypothetical protein